MGDQIYIEALEIQACIGVSESERAVPQRLTVTLVLEPAQGFAHLADRIEEAVDYAAVCAAVEVVAMERPRCLLETLAEDVAAGLLARFSLGWLTVEARKFALPQTRSVAVRITRP